MWPYALPCLLAAALVFALFFRLRKTKPQGKLQYRFCPNCASKLETRDFEGKDKLACPTCEFVYWNTPIVVGVAVIPHRRGGIVLTKRGIMPQKGKWCLPGGFAEPFEGPAETAAREALEETSLKIDIVRLLAVHKAPGANQVLVFFEAKPVDEEPVKGSDAEEVGVFPLDQIPADIAFSTHAAVIQQYIAEKTAAK